MTVNPTWLSSHHPPNRGTQLWGRSPGGTRVQASRKSIPSLILQDQGQLGNSQATAKGSRPQPSSS